MKQCILCKKTIVTDPDEIEEIDRARKNFYDEVKKHETIDLDKLDLEDNTLIVMGFLVNCLTMHSYCLECYKYVEWWTAVENID